MITGIAGELAQHPQRFEAVEFGHHHVEQHDVGQFGADGFECFQAVVRLDDLMPLQFEVHADEIDHARLVVHDEDALAIARVAFG